MKPLPWERNQNKKVFQFDEIGVFKIFALALLIIAWINGVVDGILAWILLLLVLDFKLKLKR